MHGLQNVGVCGILWSWVLLRCLGASVRLHRHAFCKGVAFVVAVLVQVCFTSLHTHVCGESQESVVRLPVAVMGFFDCIQVQQHRNPGHACDWGDCVWGYALGCFVDFCKGIVLVVTALLQVFLAHTECCKARNAWSPLSSYVWDCGRRNTFPCRFQTHMCVAEARNLWSCFWQPKQRHQNFIFCASDFASMGAAQKVEVLSQLCCVGVTADMLPLYQQMQDAFWGQSSCFRAHMCVADARDPWSWFRLFVIAQVRVL